MDYPELVAEVSERLGQPGFISRADHYVQLAEVEIGQYFLPHGYPYFNSLVEVPSNWVLRENPEIYIAAVIKQFHMAQQDVEGTTAAGAALERLVMARRRADNVADLYSARLKVEGCRP